MTITVNVTEATAKFSELLNQVLLGEEVVITEQGIPVARLVALTNTSSPRIPGLDKGKVFRGCLKSLRACVSLPWLLRSYYKRIRVLGFESAPLSRT
ncbi:type II toxin-antitoxin system Phd/YefM family antitoxin [Nostoc sp.]|uniref:type II toxin-antitoxin system Phd/YefM family antitoxin n=1 Tax=Nostoc sp. TaxID=1180 RepID=UPI002FF65BCA